MTHSLRALVLAGVAAALIAPAASVAQAQDFPSNPITIVVNWPAGGGQDTVARLIAEYAGQRTSVPIVVTNVTGAGGAAGVRHATEASPDGYTVGIMGSSDVAQTFTNENAAPLEAIDPLSFFGPDPGALEVRADTGLTSVAEYLDALRAEPGSLANGNDAPGGSSYIVASLIESTFGVEMTKVPYQGYAPTVAAILSGEVESATLPVHQLAEQHRAGEIVILGVAAEERHFLVPDVPTFQEQGFDFVAGDWRALFLPVGVPAERKAYLEELFFETMSDLTFQEAARAAGFVVTPMNAADTGARIAAHAEAVYPILVDAGLVAN